MQIGVKEGGFFMMMSSVPVKKRCIRSSAIPLFGILLLILLLISGCGGSAETDNNRHSNSQNSTAASDDASQTSADGGSPASGDDNSSILDPDQASGSEEENFSSSSENIDTPSAAAVCRSTSGGSSGAVAEPVLRMTLPGSWDESWLAAPAVADIDGDGSNEIIASRHSVIYVWQSDGRLRWQTAFGHSTGISPDHGATRMWASPVVVDLDGDGDMEIAVGGDADSSINVNICVYDHRGQLLPGWPQRFGSTEVRSIAAADVDGDGIHEILINKTGAGPATAVYEMDGRMHANWPQVSASCDPPEPAEPCWDFGGYNQNIGAGDLDGDGVMDIVSTYDSIGFGVFDGNGNPFQPASEFSDAVITAVEAYHDLSLSQQGWGNGDRSEFTYSPPVLADIDGDGDFEIVLAGDHEHSQSTANRGVALWVLNEDLTRPSGWRQPKELGAPLGGSGDLGQNIVHTMPSPSAAQLDGNGGADIVVPGYDGVMYAFRADGTIYWQYVFSRTASPYTGASEAVIADLNQDGVPEIVFNTFSSGSPGQADTPAHLIILSSTGELLRQVRLFGRGSMAAPTIADSDGDGTLEIIVSLKDTLGGGEGGVQIWDLPGSAANCLLWETGRGGNGRQGNTLH